MFFPVRRRLTTSSWRRGICRARRATSSDFRSL